MNTTIKVALIGFSAIGLSAVSLSAQAASLIQNGGFVPSTTAINPVSGTKKSAFLGNNNGDVVIPNWTVNGYNFIVPDGTLIGTNMATFANGNQISLYTNPSGTQVVNSVPGVGDSVGSGWFIVADGDPNFGGAISQTLTGLTVGQKYDVTFYQAAGQQTGFTGNTTEQWKVSFGATNQTTPLVVSPFLPSGSPVTPWQQEKLTFTADAATDVLSFLAVGTPSGKPPFSLLSGVSVNPAAVPEPLEFAGTIAGISLCLVLRSKLAQKKSATDK